MTERANNSPFRLRARDQARVQINILAMAAAFVLVAAATLHYVGTRGRGPAQVAAATNGIALSDSTRAVLNHLDSPVEIRFYSLLDQATVPASWFSFADRANQLLSEFQRQGNGKVNVIRSNSFSDSAANAASSDGLKPFNLDKGNACYLGLVVVCNEKRESLPELSPEWEQALEFDLSRAIEHVARSQSSMQNSSGAPTRTDAAVIEEVNRAIPNLASVPLEEGTRILRESALDEFKAAANALAAQVGAAQQRLGEAQKGGSEAEQQAAMKQLQQSQAEQAEKLKQIAARLQARVAALKQLKGQ